MLTVEQLEMRRTGVSASDVSPIVGIASYKNRTIRDVYADKISPVPDKPDQAKRLGHHLEQVALSVLAEERGLVLATCVTERHPILNWALASPDASVLDSSGGERIAVAEAKAVGYWMADAWGDDETDEIPEYVRVQVAWQMLVTKTKLAHVVALIGTEPRFYRIEHDEELACALLEVCDGFWRKHVLARVPPELDGSEASVRMVRALFPRQRLDMLRADADSDRLAKEFLQARAAVKAAEAEKTAAEVLLCAHIGEHEGIEGNGWRAYWRNREPVEVKAHVRAGGRAFDLREVKPKMNWKKGQAA